MQGMAATARSMFVCAKRGRNDHLETKSSGNQISIYTKLDIIRVFADGAREVAMAKGQLRSNKEKKKPKAEWNKKKKGGPVPSPSLVGQLQSASGQSPFAKKM